jgi:hypothetical protein
LFILFIFQPHLYLELETRNEEKEKKFKALLDDSAATRLDLESAIASYQKAENDAKLGLEEKLKSLQLAEVSLQAQKEKEASR